MMKITVVIPCYNEAAHLPACLESLKAQARLADDIIVVDNNSTDDSAAIAKSYGAKVIKEPRQGMTYARNAGFDVVEEGIIARTDADAQLPRDWLQRIEWTWRQNPDVLAVSGPRIHTDIP